MWGMAQTYPSFHFNESGRYSSDDSPYLHGIQIRLLFCSRTILFTEIILAILKSLMYLTDQNVSRITVFLEQVKDQISETSVLPV